MRTDGQKKPSRGNTPPGPGGSNGNEGGNGRWTGQTGGGETNLSLGFDDLGLSSQRVFRLALSAMSRPAHRLQFNFAALFRTSPPLPPGLAAMALTLADHITPIWLSPALTNAGSFLVFHTSAPIVKRPEEAVFILAASRQELPPLASLNQGDPRYPDRSATVILANNVEETSPGLTLTAIGPGLSEEVTLRGHGLDMSFVEEWALNRASYPLGADVFLAGRDNLAGLPRSLALIPKQG